MVEESVELHIVCSKNISEATKYVSLFRDKWDSDDNEEELINSRNVFGNFDDELDI